MSKIFLICLLGLVGFTATFGVAFVGDTHCFGDAPPLPPHYFSDEDNGCRRPVGIVVSPSEFKTYEAFGRECDEQHRAIKVWLPSRGAILTMRCFDLLKDGRVKLSRFSGGFFGMNQQQGASAIDTVQCEFTILTLDRPAASLRELVETKVVDVEFLPEASVKLTNKRNVDGKVVTTVRVGPEAISEAVELILKNGGAWDDLVAQFRCE